jgi:Acyl-coenzyme A oxidase N-terminal
MASAPKRTVNPDLAQERASSSIDVGALTALLDGGAARSARRRELEAVIENDPVFSNAGNIFMVSPATCNAISRIFHRPKLKDR